MALAVIEVLSIQLADPAEIYPRDGHYTFKTIIPGAYPADTDWERPPHIHFMLSKRGYHELITQMYFKGHPLNPTDRILRGVPAHMRDDVLVDFQANPQDPGTQVGTFNITFDQSLDFHQAL